MRLFTGTIASLAAEPLPLFRGVLACLLIFLMTSAENANAQRQEELLTSPLAEAFGAAPRISGARLSPDGRKVSFIQMDADDRTIVGIIDVASHRVDAIAAGDAGGYQFDWCGWANETRVLCGLFFFGEIDRRVAASSRLVAMDSDGSNAKVILPFRLGRFQDNLIDWIPDDPEHVLITVPSGLYGESIARLNVYDATLSEVSSEQSGTIGWLTDGRGALRAYTTLEGRKFRWYARARDADDWLLLHESDVDDWEDRFALAGFGGNLDELLVFDTHEGRVALFAIDLASGGRRLFFAHSDIDISAAHFVGKYRRLSAVRYLEDRPKRQFLDQTILNLRDVLQQWLGEVTITVVDEDWTRENYLIHASGDHDPGTYHHFDVATNQLTQLGPANPALTDIELASIRSISYTARDGTRIRGYLTLPPDSDLPAAVVLPHGGSEARDYLGYDFLVQFLAASGYAVLQGNFRGSSGYRADWVGDGAFRRWDVAVSDIVDGARHIGNAGLVDPGRICAAGWSYGGYSALLSAAETTDLFRCVVSIAGISDLRLLSMTANEEAERALGITRDLFDIASPARRAEDIGVPVLLFHGKWDIDVPFVQSERLERMLQRADVPVEFIEYEYTDHYFLEQRYRYDLLTRMAAFLNAHIGQQTTRAGTE